MKTYIGADLGTSSIKLSLVDDKGIILNEVSKDYPLFQKGLYSEQNPLDWWEQFNLALDELLEKQNKQLLQAISFSGQMHGLVMIDKDDKVIRPCILWNDGRSEKETKYLNEEIGRDVLSELTGNIAYAGFTAPKLLWVKNNEPENFKKIAKIMLPKDYLVYRLTGICACDYSDASGTLYLDVKNKVWSEKMLQILGVSKDKLPKLVESNDVVGVVNENFRIAHNIPEIKVVMGAGDNAASAVGMGVIRDGEINISLGTSGTIFIPTDEFLLPKENGLHSFANTTGKYHLMGCILTAASARKWWLENILDSKDYSGSDKESENANTDNLYFLPYLSGERSPHNDVNAKGAFIGLTHSTTRAALSKAIMEGVAFALRDCLEIAKEGGREFKKATICGGGSHSDVWVQIMSDILNLPIYKGSGSGSYGAALLAMSGSENKSLEEVCDNIVEYGKVFKPNPESVDYYNNKYKVFVKLYPALKNL